MMTETDQDRNYDVFTRTWWKENPAWPKGLEPHAGPKHYIARAVTLEDARQRCKEWNDCHRPGKLSRKAEFEER